MGYNQPKVAASINKALPIQEKPKAKKAKPKAYPILKDCLPDFALCINQSKTGKAKNNRGKK